MLAARVGERRAVPGQATQAVVVVVVVEAAAAAAVDVLISHKQGLSSTSRTDGHWVLLPSTHFTHETVTLSD
jgi:hypothetical protein